MGAGQDAIDGVRLRERYGPWAVIAGASEGMGRDYARMLAEQGVHCVLVSRRQPLLDELAAGLERDHGIQTRAIALDLSERDASQRLFDLTADLDVGLYISNAGADSRGAYFLDCPIDDWLGMLQRNTATVMGCCHRFATAMKQRGRGGILIMASGAGLGGGPRLAVYSATKAFEIAFAESLWSELGPHGIDVTCLVAPATDTPALRRLLERSGLTLEGLFASEEVARTGLRELGRGPTYIFPFADVTPEQAAADTAARRERVEKTARSAGMFFGDAD
ncbi:SDR family NAD(P)-dependent oxidoreductase [Streptomyces sp. GQFP]|uniref:SDR family NAD(P)-dependent oxidoreductase n=1 Tax=Streptomyces sp. GQFP TaxID=2907545 RepID=UPI001F3F6797|nr:SDR family NAD(P)-dependent oxidoreductase [Streptomyces sp. GQFP]UIX29299.1 SDR family NAD(P)-dependent oxidoreductase [Streptomyces sp. GQFP]